jgi:hypothetical protein
MLEKTYLYWQLEGTFYMEITNIGNKLSFSMYSAHGLVPTDFTYEQLLILYKLVTQGIFVTTDAVPLIEGRCPTTLY